MAHACLRRPFVTLGLCSSLLGWNGRALAEISSSPKGLIGGALLGAELTVIGEAIVGLQAEWMYMAGAAAGGVAGGVGGYLVDDTNNPGWSVALLVGGMALSIPALVVSLDATRRHWPEPSEQRLPSEPTSNPPDPAAGPELTLHLLPKGGKKLLRTRAAVEQGGERSFEWSLPDVYVSEAFSPADRDRYRLPMATLIQVPVFAATW